MTYGTPTHTPMLWSSSVANGGCVDGSPCSTTRMCGGLGGGGGGELGGGEGGGGLGGGEGGGRGGGRGGWASQ